jgi:tetratricopeptide (TPR) repeat protein
MDSADAKAKKDFFISYTGADRQWAEWIAFQLKEAGYTLIIQAWDFHAGGNFVFEMHRAARETTRTVAVLSPNYLDALFTHPEWIAAFAHDPTGTERLLIPVRIADFKPDGMFAGKIYIDLVGLKEDEVKARLLDEIVKSIQGGSIPPSTPPAFPQSAKRPAQSASTAPRFPGSIPDHCNLPHRNPNFSGREQLLLDLRESLAKGQKTALTQQALYGLGGIGKTQLAIEYAYRHSASYEVIWWIRSEEPSTLASDYAALALELNLPEKEEANQAVVVQAVTRWLEHSNNWLLIFDNARDADSIKPYLPRSASGHVLITSRNPDWRSVVNPLQVEVWERNESVSFLLKRTGRTDEAGANALAEALGDLPLALEQAAAYCDNKKKSFADYLTLFNTRRSELWSREKAPDGYKETVATTWSLAFEEIRKVPMAEELLSLCSIVAPDAIPRTLLDKALAIYGETVKKEETIDEFVIDDAYGALRSYSLITLDEKFVTVHRLVQSVVRDRMSEDDLARYRNAMVVALYKQFPQNIESEPSCWPECAILLPDAQVVIEDTQFDFDAVWNARSILLNQMASYHYGRAVYEEAVLLLRRALKIKEMLLGPEHLDVAQSLNNLAELLREQGNYREAESLHRHALEIRENQLGIDHSDVAQSLNNQAVLQLNQGKYTEAEQLLCRALEILEKQLGLDHLSVAISLNNLAASLRAQGKYGEADPLYRRSLKIREDQLGPDHPEVAQSLNNLGLLLQDQGKYSEAGTQFRRSLAIFEQWLGGEHPKTKVARINLDNLLHMMQGEQ